MIALYRLILLAVLASCLCAATSFAADAPDIKTLDPAMAAPSADGATLWFNARELGIENQGWTALKHPYDRLPAEAEGVVPDPVWSLSHHSAGLCVRFITNSPAIAARWSLRSSNLAMNHMAASGVSGLDLYVKHEGAWGWIGSGQPGKQEGNETTLLSKAPEGAHEYMIYLPLYNGIESLDVGIQPGATLGKAPEYPKEKAKPILFWGSSILQGGCATRPGMAYPSIIGRRMQRPIINLGFSGNGRMDPPLVALIAKLDVAAYVIDCAPNMDPGLITERTGPLVKTLRDAHPDTPIVLVENVPYQQGWFRSESRDAYVTKNAALKAAYEKLGADGVKGLYYIPCDQLFGTDHEATVDGTHATDLGFLRMADVIEPVLRRILE